MSRRRRRSGDNGLEAWPGYVDALSTLLMVTIFVLLVFVLAEAAQLAQAASPEIWRRYLTLILDGMRPGREGTTPLPVAALLPGEMEKSMRQAAPRRH